VPRGRAITFQESARTNKPPRAAYQEDSMSNSLGEFHHAEEAETKSNKIIHWVIALVVVAGIGIYAFESGMFSPETAHTAKTYPRGL
jgi:hypothetical protein